MNAKNSILKISLLTILIIAGNCASFSQTSDSRAVSKTETVSFLIEQNKNARDLIEVQNARIRDLEAEVAAEKENAESIAKSYGAAKSEIDALKRSNAALERAVSLNEQTIELLKADNDKQRAKVKKANKEKWKAYAVAGVAIALKILL